MDCFKKYLLIFAAILTALISACAHQEEMETEIWCAELQDSFKNLGIGWPIAQNGSLSPEQADGIERIMQDFTDTPKNDDLKFVSKVWSEKYTIFRPYLESGDLERIETDIAETDKQEMHLANVAISNFCQWNSW